MLNKVSILGILLIETKPLIHSRFWSERKRHKRTNMHTYLPTPSIHKAFNIHTNSTCAFIKNGKLWLVVEKSSHLLYTQEKKTTTTSTTTSLQFDVFLFDSPNLKIWVDLMLTQWSTKEVNTKNGGYGTGAKPAKTKQIDCLKPMCYLQPFVVFLLRWERPSSPKADKNIR